MAKQLVTDGPTRKTQSFGAVTQTGAILGTPGYMSPEQSGREPRDDRRGDGYLQFGGGFVCDAHRAAAVSGRLARGYRADDSGAGSDRRRRLLDPKVDRDLEMIALKCLQKPAELRYASADELADDLEAYLGR